MTSNQFNIKPESDIPYYEETGKRSFLQLLKKIKNTLFALIAYVYPSNAVRVFLHRRRGVNIGNGVYIGMYCFIDNLYPDYIYIEDGACVNAQSMILAHFNPKKQLAPIMQAKVSPVLICKNAIVAVRGTILPGVTIGECAIVSAGSIVDKNVPSYTMVKGNPAKQVAEYELLLK